MYVYPLLRMLGPGPGPISMMAEHMGINDQGQAIVKQSIGNIHR